MTGSNMRTTPVYVVRPIATDAARAEASAFAEDYARALAEQGINVSARPITSSPGGQALGVYEDDVLVGALVMYPHADMRHWGVDGREPGLFVSLDHTADGQVGQAITLWLADYAASADGTKWVWCEVPTAAGDAHHRLAHLGDFGWECLRPGCGRDSSPVARLRLRARSLPGIAAVISAPYLSAGRAVSA
ncbi:hypothetical protein [Streptomyces sp. NPDC001750]|uniref:hypothetical protein n=1 Tax=Streptomyces sp. NPDC001750 TaxID=3364607 RepID=UPI0036BB57B3